MAKAVYDSAYKYTPKLRNGEAEFFFVANDPTVEVVDYLKEQNYPFIINANDHLSDKQLFKLGYGKPEYMRRVYQGYNQGILHAKGQKIVLINSDNFFSQDWLENLLKYSDYKKVVTSTLLEPGHGDFGVFPGAIQKDFGSTLETYKEERFQDFAAKISKTGYTSGGAYMPCLLYKDITILAGLYPEGNVAGETFDDIKRYGDEYFYDRLKSFGIEHITAKDSIVYHLKEGERSEDLENTDIVNDIKYKRISLGNRHEVKSNNLISYIKPEFNHQEILDALGHKFTVVILHFNNNDELHSQIKKIHNLTNKNIEIVVLYDNANKNFIGHKDEGVKYVYAGKDTKDVALYKLLHNIYGEYLVVSGIKCAYDDSQFEKVIKKDVLYYIGNKEASHGLIIDSIGNFVIPKSMLLSDIGSFLGLFMSADDIEISLEKCVVINADIIEQVISQRQDSSKSFAIRSALPYRIARKLYHEGPKGIAKAIISRIKNQ